MEAKRCTFQQAKELYKVMLDQGKVKEVNDLQRGNVRIEKMRDQIKHQINPNDFKNKETDHQVMRAVAEVQEPSQTHEHQYSEAQYLSRQENQMIDL